MITSNTIAHTKREEGVRRDKKGRHTPYRCTAGALTIGYGHNLDANGISDRVAELLLMEDLAQAEADARSIFKTFDNLSEARQGVLVDMTFQMGKSRLSGFPKFIAAVRKGDFQLAVKEMLDSKWAREDSPQRAARNANIFQRGVW